MPRTFTPADGLAPVDLVHCGLDHLTAAQELFDSNPSHYDSAGYLAHMAIELLLKGWLLETAGRFQGIHNLDQLYQELVASHGAPKLSSSSAATLGMLDSYGELRYPNLANPIEVGNADQAGIEALAGEICRSMPRSLEEALARVVSGTKAGRILMRKRIDESAGDS